MDLPPSTTHADQAEQTISKKETTNSCTEDESLASIYNHQKLTPSKRTSFLDLPGELRNKIYRPVLRYGSIRNLKLKYKFTRNGSTYIHERYPPLYHALPELPKEILSIYYSESKFRVHLWTEERRNIFRDWVQRRGRVLDGLKYLELIFRRWRRHHEIGFYYSSVALRLTFDPDGNLAIPCIMPMFNLCPCWVVPLVEAAYKQCIAESPAAHRKPIHNEISAVNDISTPNPSSPSH